MGVRKGWTKTREPRSGVAGEWRHNASGWLVKHCGHPTALWPYYGLRPGADERNRDELLLAGGFGLGLAFRTLAECMDAVEVHVLREKGMREGYAFVLRGQKKSWRKCPDERWEIVMYCDAGGEERIGTRTIDDTPCGVFLCKDGKVRAQACAALGEVP